MPKSKTIKMNPLERWQKAGELGNAIQSELPADLRYLPLETIFTSERAATLTPEIRQMYNLRQRLRANSYGQA
jgi:hypothetical protein